MSILFFIETIPRNQFRCYYLKNKTLFQNFLRSVRNLPYILKFFKKNLTLIADVFPKLRTPKHVVGGMTEKSRFRELFEK